MKNLILIALTLLVQAGFAQLDTVNVRTYGGVYDDFGSEIIETSDGGYAVIGTTGSYGQGQANVYFLKLNNDLEKEWSKVFGGENIDWGQSLIEVEDGYLLLGYTNSFGAGGYDIYLVKCDFNGNLIWEKTYGGSDWDFGYKIMAYNNGFYLAGESWSYTNGAADAYLIQVDEEGNEIWSDHFGGSFSDAFYDLFEGNNGLIATGTIRTEPDQPKAYLVEISPDHTTTAHQFGEENEKLIARCGLLHSNGNYYISGQEWIDSTWNYLFLRLDAEYNLLPVSSNSYGGGGTDIAYALTEISNGGLTLVGESDSYVNSIGIWSLRVNHLGEYAAAPTFGGSQDDIGRSIIINSEGKLMVLGETNSFGSGNYDVYLYQLPDDIIVQEYILDELFIMDDLLTSTEATPYDLTEEITIFPNPATTQFTIESHSNWDTIRLLNSNGHWVFEQNLNSTNIQISTEGFPKGIYIVEVIRDQKLMHFRLLIQ